MTTLRCPKCIKHWESSPLADRVPQELQEDSFPLIMNAETLVFLCAEGHHYTADEVADMQKPGPKKTRSVPQTNAKSSREVVQDAHAEVDAAGSEICKESEALPDYIAQSLADVIPAEVELIPSGDLRVPVLVRETYVEAIQQLASESDQTVTLWLQERVDFWMEQEFSRLPVTR